MTQQTLFDGGKATRRRKVGRVPKSSVVAWMASDRTGRAVTTARMLRKQRVPVTSAELAAQAIRPGQSDDYGLWISTLLRIRRGLSDALAAGAVVHAGKRECQKTGILSLTWKLAPRR